MAADSYSRKVAWLKVALPLAALALLSTLFLLSRAIDPTASIPFADNDVQARLRDQQVTGPFFSGITANGDEISFVAEKLTTPAGKLGTNSAQELLAQIDLVNGTRITLQSETAEFDLIHDQTHLSGDVVIITSAGYELRSDALVARMSRLEVTSPGPVDGITPMGDLSAGQMHISTPDPDAPAQLIFTNGVKLIYQPETKKD